MSGQPLRLSPLDCTCFRIRGAARRVTQIYSKHLAPTGLKISQFSLLGSVTAEGPVSIGRLSDLLATDRTTLTRNLAVAEEQALVAIGPGDDARSRIASITGSCPKWARQGHGTGSGRFVVPASNRSRMLSQNATQNPGTTARRTRNGRNPTVTPTAHHAND